MAIGRATGARRLRHLPAARRAGSLREHRIIQCISSAQRYIAAMVATRHAQNLEPRFTAFFRRKVSARRSCIGASAAFVLSVAQGCIIPLSTNNLAEGGSGSSSGSSPDTPIPAGSWMNVTSNLANRASECGNLTSVFKNPHEDELIAGVAASGLWASRDGGGSWQQLGKGSSVMIQNRPTSVVFDPLVKGQYWEAGIYGAGSGAFRTSDEGNTFVPLGTIHHDNLISIDFTDAARQTLLVGGHEQDQTLYRSTNGGQAWVNVGLNLPAQLSCNFPLIFDRQTHLVGCGEFSSTGIYKTTDGGTTWKRVSMAGVLGAPLVASIDRFIGRPPTRRGWFAARTWGRPGPG